MRSEIRDIFKHELNELSSILNEAAEWLKNNEMETWSQNQPMSMKSIKILFLHQLTDTLVGEGRVISTYI